MRAHREKCSADSRRVFDGHDEATAAEDRRRTRARVEQRSSAMRGPAYESENCVWKSVRDVRASGRAEEKGERKMTDQSDDTIEKPRFR